MGQTLTHGIYLPDEGERNCYSGLAANWQILDNSVGTIAANTAALAGKAPLVHTHTKADITDFPAYGNAAGTICEGNDSRLSDARTPVAHTHGKADITDLLNSNFIPSANNSYELGNSSYKWKTLNGIDPGALSLPDIRRGGQIDITTWDNRASPGGVIGNFTAPIDCIVSIQMTRDVDWGVWVINGNFRQTFRSANNSGVHLIFLTFPVAKGEGIGIYCPIISSDENPITFVPNKQLYFPCLGNV